MAIPYLVPMFAKTKINNKFSQLVRRCAAMDVLPYLYLWYVYVLSSLSKNINVFSKSWILMESEINSLKLQPIIQNNIQQHKVVSEHFLPEYIAKEKTKVPTSISP